jgi:diguanylate cyclase (GGDEF)-like protein
VRDVFAPVKRLPMVIAALLYSTVAAILLDTIDLIGVVQSTVLCILLAAAALRLLGASGKALGWLCAGLGIRSLLALGEAVAYGMRIRGHGAAPGSAVGIYLSAQSSFDTAAEWLIALGCVLALYHRIQSELIAANGELTAAQQVLQQLADHDPLTGLANRRSVPAALAQAYGTGATILFFDLDDFKEINDRYGHHTGDEALRRFARAAQECFRPGDDVIRYAGDEFVVIARSIEPAALVDRIDALQRRLHEPGTEGPPIGFSVGWSYLPVGGEADHALKSADEAMYRQKFARRERQERQAG